MSAIIIMLAGWRMAQRPPQSQALPSAIEVALDYVIWLRLRRPWLEPQEAAEMIGASASTWAQVVLAYAAAWEKLPEEIRRRGNT